MTDEHREPQDPIPSDLVREDASFEDVVQAFVDGLGKRIDAMEEAFAAGDVDLLRRSAHQLKGSGGGYGYEIISQLAAQTEQDTVKGDLESVRKDLDDLRSLVSRVVVRLD